MMRLDPITLEPAAVLKGISEFRQFLTGNPTKERDQYLPFFRDRPQMFAFAGTLFGQLAQPTHWKSELDLWGDFVCDFVVGSPTEGAYVLFEFEDAKPDSLFARGRVKNSLWGARVEKAVSQVNDWLFRLHSEARSDQMERDFGRRDCRFMVVIVVGRSKDVSGYDRMRLDWRSQHTAIAGSNLSFFTYDDLLEWLDLRAKFSVVGAI